MRVMWRICEFPDSVARGSGVVNLKEVVMINVIRSVLKGNATIYNNAAKVYHFALNIGMRVYCNANGIRYFTPTKPINQEKYKSQYGQDCVLEELGVVVDGGFFVEVGSNDPVLNSNSFFLEKTHGYYGISIDALDYSNDFKVNRPNTIFINCLVDDSQVEVEFFEVSNAEGWQNQMSTVYKETLDSGKGFSYKSRLVPARKLSEICANVPVIDILMLDVEGHEINVLDSFDWVNSNKPKVILAENCGTYYPRGLLVKYLRDRGYVLQARIGTSDDVFRLI